MITHLNEKLIAVEVPSDAVLKTEPKNEYLSYTSKSEDLKYNGESQLNYVPVGLNFKILGEVDADNISFDVEPYLESYFTQFTIKNKLLFKNYLEEKINSYLESKNESFLSLLQSKGIDTNKPNVKHVILEKL